MATCTMAKVRSLGLLPTSLATRALAVTFQSVTTSAHAGATHSAAATMPGSRTATGGLGITLMAGLLVLCGASQNSGHAPPPPASKITYLLFSSIFFLDRSSHAAIEDLPPLRSADLRASLPMVWVDQVMLIRCQPVGREMSGTIWHT